MSAGKSFVWVSLTSKVSEKGGEKETFLSALAALAALAVLAALAAIAAFAAIAASVAGPNFEKWTNV